MSLADLMTATKAAAKGPATASRFRAAVTASTAASKMIANCRPVDDPHDSAASMTNVTQNMPPLSMEALDMFAEGVRTVHILPRYCPPPIT